MTHQTGTTIASSPSHGSPERQREIALIGNPNTGKTTIFNRLTGARQRVGNYPGVTVEKKLGTLKLGDHASVAVIDLPGAYSLAAASADERVVLDVLMGRIPGTARPDVVVCVVDASNLMRNLFLASQVADTGIPQVVALNMMDCAREQGVAVDPGLLSQRLGVPVVPITATRGEGVEELKRAIHALLSAASSETLNRQLTADNPSTPGIAPMPWPASVEQAVGELDRAIRHDLGGNEASSVSRVELLRLLFDAHSAIPERLGWPRSKADAAIARARTHLEQHGLDPVSAEAMLRYGRLAELLEGVIVHPGERKPTRGESADRVLTHRVWGLLFFV
ncbi:MAG: 50S ribosome-binding GTPase, partial [Phycisphaerales bacterium]|nr:50S ribosome-binding GTPase [Phycisphaerales bacterium]